MAIREDSVSEKLDLLEWKRRVFALYAEVRAAADPERGWARWREERADLFARHPQSPRPGFDGLAYFPYDRAWRVLAELEAIEPDRRLIGSSGGEPIAFTRLAIARLAGAAFAGIELELYWLDAYGGGLFLPFRDATAGRETYGAGRYLLDTVKGADLGAEHGRLVLDFNFAYNPSCAYDPSWLCPLAPPPNRLAVEIRAGELTPG